MARVRAIALVTATIHLSIVSPARSQAIDQPADDIAAWNAFADQVRETGEAFLSSAHSTDAVTRAEGLRYLARQLAISIDTKMSEAEPQPVMRLTISDIRKTGLDAAEAKYVDAAIDPKGTYRFWGRIGTARHIAIQLYGLPVAGASLNQAGLSAGKDGRFEIRIGPTRPAGWTGPWLRIAPHDNKLYVREYFDDWEKEEPSEFYIARIDKTGAPAPLDQSHANALVRSIGSEFKGRLPVWIKQAEGMRGRGLNNLTPPESSTMGLADNHYGKGWFTLKADEALVVEMDPPKARFWSFQLGNYWWESLDYVNHTSSLTQHQAVPSADGRYRIVISLQNPGIANWLDPAGHGEGAILYRYILTEGAPPVPQMRKVPFASLAALPVRDFPRITPEQREASIRMRRMHVAKRWAP